MNKVSRETLYDLYIIRGKPMHEVAKELGIAVGTVYSNFWENRGKRGNNESISIHKCGASF